MPIQNIKTGTLSLCERVSTRTTPAFVQPLPNATVLLLFIISGMISVKLNLTQQITLHIFQNNNKKCYYTEITTGSYAPDND